VQVAEKSLFTAVPRPDLSPSAIDIRVMERFAPDPEFSDADILSLLCDLFAGRTQVAFGEDIDWWAETFQCDLGPKAASGVALVALSKWPFDHRAGASGVKALREQLLQRARLLIERAAGADRRAA